MIGISYQKGTPKYDTYVENLSARVSSDFLKFMKKWPRPEDDAECIRFMGLYLTEAGYEALVNTPATGLRAKIEEIEQNFPQLRNCRKNKDLRENDTLYQFLRYHFVKHGFEDGFQERKVSYVLPKDELTEAVGAEVCPYCNRIFIYSQKSLRKAKIVQSELDHFYSKELFPYLAIAKYNLVPSCSPCNRQGGKFTEDAYAKGMVNPYEIGDSDDYLDFRLRVKSADLTSLEKMAKGLSLKLIAKKPAMKANIEVFNLEELYQHHTDYVAELYYKSLVKASHVYRQSMKGLLKKNQINLTDDDIKRIIVGNYVKKEEYHKRPLSKMMHDVAAELELI